MGRLKAGSVWNGRDALMCVTGGWGVTAEDTEGKCPCWSRSQRKAEGMDSRTERTTGRVAMVQDRKAPSVWGERLQESRARATEDGKAL